MSKVTHFALSFFAILATNLLRAEDYPSSASDLAVHDEHNARIKEQSTDSSVAEEEEESEGHSFGHKLLMYIPNRILDVFDVFRLRARVGPGVAIGIRATEAAQVYAGTYASVYLGLPGPRRRPLPRLPVGLESYNGVAVSIVDATASGGIGPDYSPTEFGFSLHPLIFGIDFGIDPVEIVDLIGGFVFLNVRDDEL